MSLARWFRSLTTPTRVATGRTRLGVEALEDRRVLNADFDLSATVTAADEVVGEADHLADLISLPGDDPVAELSAAIAALGNDSTSSGFDLSAEVTPVSPWDLFGTFEDGTNPFGLTDVTPVGEIDASAYTITDWSDALDPTDYAEVDASPLPDIDWASLNPQPLPPREFEVYDAGEDFDIYALNPQPLPPREFEAVDFGPDLDIYALNPQPLPPMEWTWSESVVPYQSVTTLSTTAISQVAAATYWIW